MKAVEVPVLVLGTGDHDLTGMIHAVPPELHRGAVAFAADALCCEPNITIRASAR